MLRRVASPGRSLGEAKLDQWCSKCGPQISLSLLPGNWLEMQILEVYLESEILGVGPSSPFQQALQVIPTRLRTTEP